ncbi:uncharacterized protein LOC115633746 [Scaptodrosophila lebanonensis]|uniref:Uncharacterized protein LOC115633746 n=1 Tax=Drosophila lebanonensis TaxID=7225 RepID=A0A6J2UF39_DROLE|nr:uncharacterized protein LOC115633746 [Scaptodrosophila lebanonensis]
MLEISWKMMCAFLLLFCLRFQVPTAAPPGIQNVSCNVIKMPMGQVVNETMQPQRDPPVLQSVFDWPPSCPPGFELTGERQRCRKKV